MRLLVDYEDSAYCSICNEYGVDPAETWMYGDWFYTTDYAVFGHGVKATEKSAPDDRQIITQSKGFAKSGIEKKSKSVMTYVYQYLQYMLKKSLRTRSMI